MARYKKGGYAYPSVTEVISDATSQPWMGPWATKEMVNALMQYHCVSFEGRFIREIYDDDIQDARWAYKKVGKEASDIGTEVHDIIEFYFKNDVLKEGSCDEANNAIDNFEIWNDKYKPRAIATEIKVYGNGWAGTADFMGWIEDRLWVLDWKTSKAHHPLQNGPQIAAYGFAIAKEAEVSNLGIVRFDKINKYTDKDFKDYSDKYEHYLRQWDLMLELFMLRHPIICRKSGWKGE